MCRNTDRMYKGQLLSKVTNSNSNLKHIYKRVPTGFFTILAPSRSILNSVEPRERTLDRLPKRCAHCALRSVDESAATRISGLILQGRARR